MKKTKHITTLRCDKWLIDDINSAIKLDRRSTTPAKFFREAAAEKASRIIKAAKRREAALK